MGCLAKALKITGVVLAVLVVLVVITLFVRMRGPYHTYSVDYTRPEAGSNQQPGQLQVGVAMRDITAKMEDYDPWVDVNGNGKFDHSDTYEDRNGNGKFDGIWVAGFNSNRPAQGINDPQWVRVVALRNNDVTVVMVTIDAIGIYYNEFIRIRKMVEEAGITADHILFSSTHCHEVPDTMKIWSGPPAFGQPSIPILGYDERYMENIQVQARDAIVEAVNAMQPADMYCAQVEIDPTGFVQDTREPQVIDPNMYLFRFTKPGRINETIATFVNWGNHPEALGGRNQMLTSDFCHYLREGVEKGVKDPNGAEGFGGMCLYFQGQIGGLMTQLNIEIPHRDGVRKFKEASFEKAEALGENLAVIALSTLRGDTVWKNENPLVAVTAKTVMAPMSGMYKWAIMLGFIHEGYHFGSKAKTEINVVRIGDVCILTTPGEIYPEIVEGGVVALPGRDFEIEPQEVPPLRTVMKGRMNFVIGLCNDEIGYMVPKSQWDTEAPFVYNNEDQYGEENSPGPEIATAIHHESQALIERLQGAFPFKAAAAPAR